MNLKYQSADANIIHLFDTISTTLSHVSQAYAYYNAYAFGDLTAEEKQLVSSEVLRFNRMTAQFFLVVQFCKLFETPTRSNQGQSSLSRLNDKMKEFYPADYQGFEQANQLIQDIKDTAIYIHLKKLRNKAYGHSEKHELNLPLKFMLLTRSQLDEFKVILLQSIQVFNLCYKFFDTHFDTQNFYNSTTPKNFLKQYSRMKKFWSMQSMTTKLQNQTGKT